MFVITEIPGDTHCDEWCSDVGDTQDPGTSRRSSVRGRGQLYRTYNAYRPGIWEIRGEAESFSAISLLGEFQLYYNLLFDDKHPVQKDT